MWGRSRSRGRSGSGCWVCWCWDWSRSRCWTNWLRRFSRNEGRANRAVYGVSSGVVRAVDQRVVTHLIARKHGQLVVMTVALRHTAQAIVLTRVRWSSDRACRPAVRWRSAVRGASAAAVIDHDVCPLSRYQNEEPAIDSRGDEDALCVSRGGRGDGVQASWCSWRSDRSCGVLSIHRYGGRAADSDTHS